MAIVESNRLCIVRTMKQTPIHDNYNAELLALMPMNISRVVEVGCGSGALASAYLKLNPDCEYVGLEIDSDYADVARPRCSRVVVGNIEHLTDEQFASLVPSDCWVFADVLEHLYDPWSALRRIHQSVPAHGSVVACIPNAQHWSIQIRLNTGEFRYEDAGLLDRTHIRWFTRRTIGELFRSTGYEIVEGGGRVFEEEHRAMGLAGVRALAEAIGADVDEAVADATPFQWLVRATPAP